MKDAATCDNSYALQNQAYYQDFERSLCARQFSGVARPRFSAGTEFGGARDPADVVLIAEP